jgi:hypothetical protein
VRFNDASQPEVVVYNMRDGYDIYPLTGLTTFKTECDSEKSVTLRPVIFGGGSIVWGHWGISGILRAWSTKSGRTVGEFDHGGRVHGLRVSVPLVLTPLHSRFVPFTSIRRDMPNDVC